MRRIAVVLAALALAAPRPAAAHTGGGYPIVFTGWAGGVTGSGVPPELSINPQTHDHPFSVLSRRGPLALPGLLEVKALVARTAAGRPGAARTQTSQSEASDVVLFRGTAQEVRVAFARGMAQARCQDDGSVTYWGEGGQGEVWVGGRHLVGYQSPNTTLVDTAGLRIVANEQGWVGDTFVVSALRVSTPAAKILLGHAAAGVSGCVAGEEWRRTPSAPAALQTSGASGGAGSFSESTGCALGGSGSHFHFDYTSALSPADSNPASQALAGRADVFLDLHIAQESLWPGAPSAFLLGGESLVVVRGARGSITAELRSGSCASPTLVRTAPNTVSGSGTWTIVGSTGAFRDARAGGTFDLTATTDPGADNTITLSMRTSNISVLMPRLTFDTSVGRRTPGGAAFGRISAALLIANDGPGDAFGVLLGEAVPMVPGSLLLDPSLPVGIPDLDAGESASIRMLLSHPLGGCDAAGCQIPVDVTVVARTALGQPVRVQAHESVVAGVPGP